jgi:ribonucleoside-diphosphate reductase alpha chain
MTDDADIRIAQSMMDYIFRRLALDYLPFETRSAIGLYSAAERARALETGEYREDVVDSDEFDHISEPVTVQAVAPNVVTRVQAVKIEAKAPSQGYGSSTELMEAMSGIKSDAPLCMTCGVKMRMSGACYVCEGCGNTSGCS